tara:strand:+ start:31 stop:882 length:852 start_codon:yes stop_codon:yes gene_type:complete
MILLDYSGIAIATIAINKVNEENMLRHMILNSIRMYNKKFREEYGEMVITVDGGNNWRRDYFPQYKANRRKGREESSFDWAEAFRIMHLVKDEIKENLPYKVLHIDKCEADDIIGTLVIDNNEFGKGEKIMIVSSDHDFKQLQKYDYVSQFSPMTKKFVEEGHPRQNLKLKILQGDAGDGVPNVLSHDDTFVNNDRQTPLSKKKKEAILKDLSEGELLYAASWYRNYQRNEKLIDLSQTPEGLRQNIIYEYLNQDPWQNKGKALPYLINKNLKELITSVEDFL